MLILEDYNNFNLETIINLIYGGSILYIFIIGIIIKFIISIILNNDFNY
jgi:hypothetical protein